MFAGMHNMFERKHKRKGRSVGGGWVSSGIAISSSLDQTIYTRRTNAQTLSARVPLCRARWHDLLRGCLQEDWSRYHAR